MILRARFILPISSPPIENGAIVIVGNKIRSVGAWKNLRPPANEKTLDLGEVILLPGLINAHCHLDYTDMAGQLPPPKKFTDWIGSITAAKTGWSYSDYAHSWLHGAHQLLKSGTTTVADIEAMPDLLPEVWDATPLRIFSFLEMTGIRARRDPKEILRETVEKIAALSHARNRASLSPHAPYSTLPELLRLTGKMARKRKWRVTTHVAESDQEFEMFQHARGDATLLAKNKTHVVHCPRSHAYFKHPPFQRQRLANAGVNLCLGTDSLATTNKNGQQKPELDLFAEMRALAEKEPSVSAQEILQMATVNGARALGLAGKIGELAAGALADVIAIPFAGKATKIYESVLQQTGNVKSSMIEGRWAIPPQI